MWKHCQYQQHTVLVKIEIENLIWQNWDDVIYERINLIMSNYWVWINNKTFRKKGK